MRPAAVENLEREGLAIEAPLEQVKDYSMA
jgi:hypothetical protein